MAYYQTLGAQPVHNPAIPYNAEIVGGVHAGMTFTLTGTVPNKANRWSVNFSTGQCDGADIAFHFNPRYDGRDKVVCNTFKNGQWGKEEKKNEMPFKPLKPFKLDFIVNQFSTQVAVDSKLFCDYKHVIDMDRIKWLQVNGDVAIQSITVVGGSAGGAGGTKQGPYGF